MHPNEVQLQNFRKTPLAYNKGDDLYITLHGSYLESVFAFHSARYKGFWRYCKNDFLSGKYLSDRFSETRRKGRR